MDFKTKLLLGSFVLTVILGIIIIPILKKLKVGQMERDDGPHSHLKKQGTPTMGGIIMAITMIILSIIAYLKYSKSNTIEEMNIAKAILTLAFVGVGFGVIGFIDDFIKLVFKNTTGLKPAYKMIGLLAISVGYSLFLIKGLNIGTDTYIPILKTYVTLPIWLYIPFAIFVLLGTTNAVNLTDGVDGLAASVCAVIITTLTVIGIICGIKEIAVFGSIAIGAVLGFLVFNLHPAKVIMGDTGSLMLGGIISGIALYLKMPLLLIIIALIPVVETLSVMIQVTYCKKTGKRIFRMAPIHHHFELSGWRENKVVVVFTSITLLVCIIGLFIV